jgi:membrane-bound ClpP family serine protease
VLLVVGLIVLIFSGNFLLVHNTTLNSYSLGIASIGNWNDWLFVVAIFVVGIFGYYVYKWIDDDRFFMKNINSDSKSHFMKNVKKLEKIAREHGMIYEQMLQNKKSLWKIR